MTLLAVLLLAATPAPHDHFEPGAIFSIPHVAVQFSEREQLGFIVTLPWAIRMKTPSDKPFMPRVFVVEGGVLIAKETAFKGRVGLRWLYPITSWLEAGAGFGLTGELGTTALMASSFEVLARFGSGPIGYGTIFGRSELRLDGSSAWIAGLGFAFW